MADYTPLLMRAVAGQDEAARAGIYARAREALERQLRTFEPKLEETHILAELEGLEKAIATVEATTTGEPAAPEPTPAPLEAVLATPPEEAAPARPEEIPDPAPDAQAPPTEAEPTDAGPAENTPAEPVAPVDALPPIPAEEVGEPAVLETESTTPPLDETEVLRSDSTSDVSAPPLAEAVIPPVARPRMPLRSEARKSRKPLVFAGIGGVLVMLGFGALALTKRGTQDPLKGPQAVQQQTASAEAGKTEGRLASEPAPRPPAETPAAPQPAPSAPTTGTAPPVETPQSTTTRAFLVMESPGNAPSQFEGAALWSFEVDPANKGQKALRTLIAFPGADMTVDLTVSRNTDKSIAASHLMMAIFEPAKGAEPVRELSPLEWRERESTQGTVLRGSVVPVQDNVFMVTLDSAAEGANLDLMLRQKWIVFEFRLANGRRGAVLVEKGAGGERAVAEAITTWK